MTERFFIPAPTPTDQKAKDSSGNEYPIYLDAFGMQMKWSGDFPIPAAGTRVFITMNGIGWAVVKGYFESAGYVGLMTLPTNPPKWLRDQRKRDLKSGRQMPDWMIEGIGCEFGAEMSLKRPKKAEAPVLL